MNKKNNKGITLVALIITIVVLIIIASITIYSGKETISKANNISIKIQNMLGVQPKFELGNGLQLVDGVLSLDIPVATASTTYGGDTQ